MSEFYDKRGLTAGESEQKNPESPNQLSVEFGRTRMLVNQLLQLPRFMQVKETS